MQMGLSNWLLEVVWYSLKEMSVRFLKVKCLLAFWLLYANCAERDAFNKGRVSSFPGTCLRWAGKPSGGVWLLPKCLKYKVCLLKLWKTAPTLTLCRCLSVLLVFFLYSIFKLSRRNSKYQRVEIALLSALLLMASGQGIIMAEESARVTPYCWRMVCDSFKLFEVHFVLLLWLSQEVGNCPDVIWEAFQKYWHCCP